MAITAKPADPILLQPRAETVDRYVRPATPSPSPLHQLASALSSLEPELNALLATRKEEFDREAALEGEAAFYSNNHASYEEARRQGLVPAHASPAFVQAYQAAAGRSAGHQLVQKFYADFQTWEGRTGTDPAAFDPWFQQWIADNIPEAENPEVLAGLLPEVTRLQDVAYSLWDQTVGNNMYRDSVNQHGANVNHVIDTAQVAGMGDPQGIDYDKLYGQLEDEYATALLTLDRADADKMFVDAITNQAIALGDETILELLNYTVPGEDYTWADTPYGREERDSALASIASAQRQAVNDEWVHEERLRERALEDATQMAIEAMILGEPIPEEAINLGTYGSPDFAIRVLGWERSLSQGAVNESEADLTLLYSDILDDPARGYQILREAMDRGVVLSTGTIEQVYRFIGTVQGATIGSGQSLSTAFPQLTHWTDTIRNRTTPTDPSAMFDAGGWYDSGLAAETDLRILLTAWMAQNPDASDLDRLRAGAAIFELISSALPEPQEGGIDAYSRSPEIRQVAQQLGIAPEDLPEASFGGSQRQPAQGAQPSAQQQPGTTTTEDAFRAQPEAFMGIEPENAEAYQQFVDGLTPDQRAYIERVAEQNNLPFNQVAEYTRQELEGVVPTATPEDLEVPADPGAALPAPGLPQPTVATEDGPLVRGPGEEQPAFDWTDMPPIEVLGLIEASIGRISEENIALAAEQLAETGIDLFEMMGTQNIVDLLVQDTYPITGELRAQANAVLESRGVPGVDTPTAESLGAGGNNTAQPQGGAWIDDNTLEGLGYEPPQGNTPYEGPGAQLDATGEVSLAAIGQALAFAPDVDERPEFTEALERLIGDAVMEREAAPVVRTSATVSDPGVAAVLNTIAGAESRGNYNVPFGNTRYTPDGQLPDLSRMTINDVIAYQGDMLDRGSPSTAIGRYQILRGTLRDLVRGLGLSGDELFTPQLQDRLAIALMERRGLSNFLDGNMTPEQFAHNLAKEWAGLPLSNGRSYYAGDSLNAATISYQTLMQAVSTLGANG